MPVVVSSPPTPTWLRRLRETRSFPGFSSAAVAFAGSSAVRLISETTILLIAGKQTAGMEESRPHDAKKCVSEGHRDRR
ncbi:hypothetical protein BR93DRAFT_930674 [Coniochaeta sp. PMI_546]|nr:hypothetical protein BR93DRAFT_930674 [Coniochaeta sp. PMI_546]